LADLAHILTVNKNYVLGYSVMLLYDHILTFGREVQFMWTHPFTMPTYLFFIFRYVTPLVCILNIIAEHSPGW
ncbi:hypothetical protein BU17DRAFT_23448, partial [Hysterangium stoloniferum]